MNKNDVVMVENQTLDGKIFNEGQAVLLNKIKETCDMEYWRVKFVDAPQPYCAFRWIRKPE